MIDVRHLSRERVIGCWEHDGVLIDPGPESCLETLVAALDGPPRAVLLTHIHFDHAGATGALLRRWPGVPVYVHERGARHMVDPERLVASASRLYGGEEGLRRMWGEVVPVPEADVHVLTGGETLLDGAFRVAYTPGHASHHVAYLHEDSGTVCAGDVAGVRIGDGPIMAPTPPPDIDVAAWHASLDVLSGWAPQRLAITHFGVQEDVAGQLDGVRRGLARQAELAAATDLGTFVARLRDEIADPTYEQAMPYDHLWLGLDRARTLGRA